MDDRDLGSLLDSTQPTVPPTNGVLDRIRRRARQRQIRARGAVVAGIVAVIGASGAAALALGSGPSGHGAPPATQPTATTIAALPAPTSAPTATTATTTPSSTTTAAVPDCSEAELTVAIDPNWEGSAGARHWPVVVTSTAAEPCRLGGLIDAAIHDSNGAIITTIPGNPTSHPLSGDGFALNTPTVIAHLGWSNPCSTGPVQLEVTGFAAPARLDLPQQPSANGPISTSHFQIELAQ